MADDTPNSAAVIQGTDIEPRLSSSVELQFPTINLQTSYESLLSNSTVSFSSTLKMTRTTRRELDESWASLQPSDYSNDEDQQSDIIDTGSLIDVSSTHDTESILGDDTPSESDLGVDSENVVVDRPYAVEEEERLSRQAESIENDRTEDTIILQQSEIQPNSDSIDLVYTTHSTESNQPGQTHHVLKEQIIMTVSNFVLDTKGLPFHVAYFGVSADSLVKEDLLGKVGAAIVLPSSSGSKATIADTSVYNVVPTEFGPGSKPTFAGLFPSHAQMSIDDVRLALQDNARLQITSNKGVLFDSAHPETFGYPPPDLLVIQLDRQWAESNQLLLSNITEYTEQCGWPTLIVSQDRSEFACRQAPGSIIRLRDVERDGTLSTESQAIDLDSFIAIDTEQLSRHLRFLQDRSNDARMNRHGRSVLRTVQASIQTWLSTYKIVRPNRVETDLNEADTTPQHQVDDAKGNVLSKIKNSWIFTAGRQTFKDTVLSIAVMLLGVYILKFSQDLTQSTITRPQSNVSTQVSVTSSNVRPNIASSPLVPDTASLVPSIDQDIMVYEPISFDQMWSRITGKPSAAAEDAIPDVPDSKQQASAKASEPEKRGTDDEPLKLIPDILSSVLNDSRNLLDTFVHRLEARAELRKEQRAQIEEMNQKILDFWSEVSQNLRNAGKQSQVQYETIVRKSEAHMRKAKWATGRKLESIFREQKKLLSRAQSQAHVLTRDVPRRKCGGLLKKRGKKCGKRYGRFWR